MYKDIIKYKQYGECAILSNDSIDIITSLEFGPRILSFSLKNHPNLLYEHPMNAPYLCSDKGWRVYGGLRLALAPESENTFWPDNSPIEYEFLDDGILLERTHDEFLNVSKKIRIRFLECQNSVEISFEIENLSDVPIVGAPWAITAVRPDGVLHVPFYNEEMSMSPRRFISIWGNTNLADKRLSFREKEIVIQHLPIDQYFKIGFNCSEGVSRYDVCGQSFTKNFKYDTNSIYPDNNVNFEVYCCRHMMEIESLAATKTIPPKGKTLHSELWTVSADV